MIAIDDIELYENTPEDRALMKVGDIYSIEWRPKYRSHGFKWDGMQNIIAELKGIDHKTSLITFICVSPGSSNHLHSGREFNWNYQDDGEIFVKLS